MSRKMKDSGIEWIGEIPEHWEIVRYKEICDIKNGYPFDSKLFSVNEGFPLIRIRDITSGQIETYYNGDYEDSYIVRKYDIIVGMDGDFNIRRWDNEDALLNQRCMKIISNNNISDGIIYYQLPFQLKIINDLTYATTVKHLSHYDVLNSKLVLPDNPEQQHKIANFLDKKVAEIDHILEKTRESIEEYKKYKQSIITEAVTKGLNPDVKMKDSGIEWIGEIPEHWELFRGKTILNILSRSVLETDNVITCFRDGEVTLRSNRREDGFTMADKEFGYQGIEPGDLVVHGMDGFAGAIGISDSRGKGSPVLNILDSGNNKEYLMFYLRSMAYNDVFTAIATGIRVRSCDLRWNKLANLPYPIPPLKEQEDIVFHISSMLGKINEVLAQKEQLLVNLEAYKKSLIYECVTGKREVV